MVQVPAPQAAVLGAVLSAGSPVQVPAPQAAVLGAVSSAGIPVQVPAPQAAVQQIATFLLIMVSLDRDTVLKSFIMAILPVLWSSRKITLPINN